MKSETTNEWDSKCVDHGSGNVCPYCEAEWMKWKGQPQTTRNT